jgi:hypothetical protein
MSRENVEVVKGAQPRGINTGIDMVQVFRISTVADPAALGIDVTALRATSKPS